MAASLHEIWNLPVTPSTLFYDAPEDEDDQMPDAPPRIAGPQSDINAIFAGVDNLPDGPGDDTRALTPHPVLSSSPAHHLDDTGDKGDGKDDKDRKKPKKAMRLDEGRLIDCFPQLVKDTKNIKIKGKGHEASDLNRLLQVYQFWTHRLYPKTPFKDTVDRVEKLCHSKRMHNQLRQWRDEAHGIADEKTVEAEDRGLIDLTDDSNPAPDSDQADYASSSSHEAIRPPSSVDGDARASSVERNFNDVRMRAAMDAAAKLNSRQPFIGRSTSGRAVDDESREAEAAKEQCPAVVADDNDGSCDVVNAMDRAATESISDLEEEWGVLDAMSVDDR
ncbi:replication fork protection component Swi3-domain-containing protein [Mycena haematopus]|nr:replication fork protection component Swi3-domain-containing protein [Mycena haematopus]